MKLSYCYSLSEKEKVIDLYHSGLSQKEISSLTGISPSYVNTLIRRYLAHGVSGLEFQPPCRLSPEYKLSIVRDITSNVLSLCEASLRYGVSLTSLYNWLRQYRSVGLQGFMYLGRRGRIKEEPMKRNKTSCSAQIPRERELERELEKARAENAYLKNYGPYFWRRKRSHPPKSRCHPGIKAFPPTCCFIGSGGDGTQYVLL